MLKLLVFLLVPLINIVIVLSVAFAHDKLYELRDVDASVFDNSETDIVVLQKQWQQIAFDQRREASLQRKWIMTFGCIIATVNLVNWFYAIVDQMPSCTSILGPRSRYSPVVPDMYLRTELQT